ncbi:MAG: S1 RNA-binding domain-containing protein [Eubacterium sp.]|nr:S1 RNA-binding domain-containing protein [Eubacterium sp.]
MENETMKDYEDKIERSFRKISEGDIIKGEVIGISEEEVTLDLNYYTQGIIKVENMSNDPDFSVFTDVTEGEEIEATVIRLDDGNGNIELSKKEANDVLVWEKLKEMMEEEKVFKIKIKESVNAGVICYLEGIRAFIPASQITDSYVENTDEWIGKEIEVKIITAEENAKKLVLSGKEVKRAKNEEALRHKISMLIPGSVMEGKIEKIMPYGAFVDLGEGLSGLIHISQISQKRLKSPNEVLKVGQSVRVKLLNTNDGKLSLSMKALEGFMDKENDSESGEAEEYVSGEEVGTGLAGLLKGIKLN